MNLPDVDGRVLGPLLRTVLTDGDQSGGDEYTERREALFRALLVDPLCMAHLAHDAAPGPSLRLSFGETIRLVQVDALHVPVAPLYLAHAALTVAGRAANWWPDGIERGAALPRGAAFALLLGQPGALLVLDEDHALPLDAGDVAALAEGRTPNAYRAWLSAFVDENRGRDAARQLARRPLYVLGHPGGGLLLLTHGNSRGIPCFLHLAEADRFAARIARQSGQIAEPGLVAATDLFKNADRGKLDLIIDPGPRALRLHPPDLRLD